jgi:type VI secretion system protein VasD
MARGILMKNQTDGQSSGGQTPFGAARRNFVRQTGFTLLALAGLLSAAACSSTGGGAADPAIAPAAAPGPRSLQVTVSASADVNPGPTGKAAPLTVQLYVLRSPGKFQSLDYFGLKDRGASELASDLVTSSSVSVRPGEKKTVTLTAGPDAGYIGVAAGYREIDSAQWRSQTDIGEATNFEVRAGKSSVSISKR